jgi:hypothetical protein
MATPSLGLASIDMEPVSLPSGRAEIRQPPNTYPGQVESEDTREILVDRCDAYLDDNRHELFLLGEGEKKVTWEEDSRKFPHFYFVFCEIG